MSVVTSGYSRNAYGTGAWNRSVVDQSVSATRVSLQSTVRSVGISIAGTHFVTGNNITSTVRSVAISIDSPVQVTGTPISFTQRNATVNLVQTANATRIPVSFVSRSAEAIIGAFGKPTSLSSSLTVGNASAVSGPFINVTRIPMSFTLRNTTQEAGANVVFYPSKTFKVTVKSVGGANKYFIDGKQQYGLNLFKRNNLYIFDQSDSTNSGHPLRLSLTPNGTHSGGDPFTANVQTIGTPGSAGAYTSVFVLVDGPTSLYYYCSVHSGMGGALNFQPAIIGGLGSLGIAGDSNLVATGVSARFSVRVRGIWTSKVFGGTNEIWKAKRL